MISVIATESGNFNVFGTRDDEGFILQGNLTEDELLELMREAAHVLGLKSLPKAK